MAGFLVKGILMGLLFGIPVGAVGTLTVQRTFRHGFTAGLKTGLGSSVSDCLYAACGAFGLTFLSDFLLKYQTVISIAGGCSFPLSLLALQIQWQFLHFCLLFPIGIVVFIRIFL